MVVGNLWLGIVVSGACLLNHSVPRKYQDSAFRNLPFQVACLVIQGANGTVPKRRQRGGHDRVG